MVGIQATKTIGVELEAMWLILSDTLLVPSDEGTMALPCFLKLGRNHNLQCYFLILNSRVKLVPILAERWCFPEMDVHKTRTRPEIRPFGC